MVRPARGLPHRDPRADEGAERQEHADRPGRRQRRFRAAPPRSRRQPRRAQRQGVAAYRDFIGALLDVTDNIVGERIAPPRTVRQDGDDPYLVVAADKGTASFSDTANGIALERGFWLGDAFASGGSAGYDHKDGHHGPRRLGNASSATSASSV
ncbi:MAG: NAD-glutamate dehydrogenase [Sinobacteraceae bacterium]|nr:NAD-glutamate dehydrogenase [Nevskiaceae bacterium]